MLFRTPRVTYSFILRTSFTFRPSFTLTQRFRQYSSDASNPWLRSLADVYKSGGQLTLAFPASNGSFEVQVVKAFTPFTNSVVLLVDAQPSEHLWRHPSRFILKLADRRASESRNWNFDKERDYQINIESHVTTFGMPINLQDYPDRPPWMDMLEVWDYFDDSYQSESEAYRRLTEAQDLKLIPRCFGTTHISMIESAAHSSLSRINGLLIEYIEGRPMSSLRPGINISVDEAETISQRVLELGRRLRRYGVQHCDVHVGNIIIRSSDDHPVLIDWGKAMFNVADLPLEQRWTYFYMQQDFQEDMRTLLRHGIYYEGPDDKSVYPEKVAGGVWHRYRTPFSDQEQYQLAERVGWDFTNGMIADLSEEEKDRFYHEDVTVDPEKGLRWRVKKGVKTRMFDDPVPKV